MSTNRAERRLATYPDREQLASTVTAMVMGAVRQPAGLSGISDQAWIDIEPLVADAVKSVLRSADFQAQVRAVVKDAMLDIVREVLAETPATELESQVRSLIAAHWQPTVEQAAREILDGHLAAIKKKIGA